ncbi:hypothetical protein ENUP19_0158G0010 [Entamoeba nuttalli]|uniref:peptidylprolyl isomerase n=2 Tax=Entamoeba nuttalli TaxID=412467 RepID=K2H6I9_ENTNP|nr:peptidyl-prolyl cis-trans isomerase, FKBP-type domain containing protein [Entamoeba nuttalli P19]EKE42122.1 peptidyl-prolyl cis-trans isomerase, FKBP-type domain containing protein [Entamoeba nuttalli P19]|eukprot:XP_008855543.1 peptidyl-prolyl cis-trans isomerase, FKBP-type domain containing protein [Entamoeba nuttalli P19]
MDKETEKKCECNGEHCECGDEHCECKDGHCGCKDGHCGCESGHCGCGDEHCGCEDGHDEEPMEEEVKESFPKTVEVEGTGYEKPTDDCLCTVDYTMLDGDRVIEEKTDFKFKVGDMPVICEGFEKGIESMKLNEKCTFTLKPEDAFGSCGDKERNIEPNKEITFKVTLKGMEPVPTPFTIAPENIVKHAEEKKAQGNEMVKRKLQKRALRCYLRALDYLDNDYRIPEDQKEAAKKIQTILFGNISAMHLHFKEYDQVIEYTDKVLAVDAENLKALLRRGKAYLEKGQVEKAESDFNKVLSIDPNNKEVKYEMSGIKRKRMEEEKNDKRRYAKMFSALGSLGEVDEEQKKLQEAQEEQRKKEWEEIKKKQEEEEKKKEEAKKMEEEKPKEEEVKKEENTPMEEEKPKEN